VTPAASLPDTGGDLSQADYLGIAGTKGKVSRAGSVGGTRDRALYQIDVLLPDSLTIAAANLKQSVQMQLLFGDGSPIATLTNGKRKTEQLVQRLDPGTYYISLSSGLPKSSPFKLTVTAKKPKPGSVAPQPPAGIAAPSAFASLVPPDFSLSDVTGNPTPELANGFVPDAADDLVYAGGRTIANLQYANLYIGGDAWSASDVDQIDRALAAAMADPNLESVVAQYFAGPASATFVGSAVIPGAAPELVSREDISGFIAQLDALGAFNGIDTNSTVVNLMLPPGTVLTNGDANSLNGLGGYHGSVHVDRGGGATATIYYAVGVYSQDFGTVVNGIPAFDQSWKDVVATFYHELNEARTDPDVQDANALGDVSLAGWITQSGAEIADTPISVAQQLGQPLTSVFVEVPLADGSGTVPVQLMWSNAHHGPANPTPQGTVTPELTNELLALALLSLFL